MKNICYIIICLLFVSCKQGVFLQRKYTDGFYFSKGSSEHIKENNSLKKKSVKLTFSDQVHILSPKEPLTDTIILNSGWKVACKVKTIKRKTITYTDGQLGPAGINKRIRNKNVARIHFKEGQKEYFNQRDQNGNPLLQFDFFRSTPQPKTGMAIFGYVLILLTSFGLFVASLFIGLMFMLYALSSLILLSTTNYESLGFKILRGIGKFYGILFFMALGVMILALIIALLAFA